MSKVFFPTRSIDVDASASHGDGAVYRVSVGTEHWGDGAPKSVYKVQMAYDGVVHGRKSPSFPENSDDMERVYAAMRRIKNGEGETGRGRMTSVGSEPGMPIDMVHNLLRATSEDVR
jgi:hypothetical protein